MPLDSVTPRPPKDIPIIFSEAMVRAELADLKKQTRRLATSPLAKVQPGDRLWVRENFQLLSWGDYEVTRYQPCDVRYAATDTLAKADREFRGYPWRPSIHMPRWASRITLVVEDVRFQRLQDITEEDARAEGAEPCANGWWFGRNPILAGSEARGAFYCLWNSLHDKPGERWEDNPKIVALTFTVFRANIDVLPAREVVNG
ncbi:hypothetical protein [Azospirillum argentinense]|uniref:Uncharacterized protein n=1 Tax=Azospirillum brasilense TaxID=192 RepID=A0A4D8QA88_AZOBR|nr:hypothetical protein [Azospirillum argentinense]QCO07307.1 hypothetical protein D3867_36105 [Azospirillum argentinense]